MCDRATLPQLSFALPLIWLCGCVCHVAVSSDCLNVWCDVCSAFFTGVTFYCGDLSSVLNDVYRAVADDKVTKTKAT